MVYLTPFRLSVSNVPALKSLVQPYRTFEQNFVPSYVLKLVAGKGGDGIREINGIGGKGGDILLEASRKITSLSKMVTKYENHLITACNGENADKQALVGRDGNNYVIKLPQGVDVYNEKGALLTSLEKHLQRETIVRGGRGGCAENNFIGEFGEISKVLIKLKLIADVGFVGFPNAGKSTLLKAISRANPKIADYAFTTLSPNIGMIEFERSFRKIKCTDLPGLIEDAHMNAGLGHEFLCHIERTKYLMFVVDPLGFQYSPNSPNRNAIETLFLLFKELEHYDSAMVEKPCLIVITKLDKKGGKLKYRDFLIDLKEAVKSKFQNLDPQFRPISTILFQDIIGISSASGLNIEYLKDRLKKLVFESDSNNRFIYNKRKSMLQIIDSKLEKIQYS